MPRIRAQTFTSCKLIWRDLYPTTSPSLSSPFEILFQAAAGQPNGAAGLPRALYDLLRRWDVEGQWPAARWLSTINPGSSLPPWDLFGPLPMRIFAAGLSSDYGFIIPQMTDPLERPAAQAPWRVRWLVGSRANSSDWGPTHWLDPALDGDSLSALDPPEHHHSVLVNLSWPPLSLANSWIMRLIQWPLVLDPDRDRVALLRLFSVRARWMPYKAVCPSPSLQHDLDCSLRQLGLPDPRWLLSHPSGQLSFAVVGSSGPASERQWATIARHRSRADFLLLPRVNSLKINSLDEARALQGWLHVLSESTCTILQLEQIHDGLCTLPEAPATLLRSSSEMSCLSYWGDHR